MIRGGRNKEGKRTEAVEEVLRSIEANVDVKECRRIGGEGEKGRKSYG